MEAYRFADSYELTESLDSKYIRFRRHPLAVILIINLLLVFSSALLLKTYAAVDAYNLDHRSYDKDAPGNAEMLSSLYVKTKDVLNRIDRSVPMEALDLAMKPTYRGDFDYMMYSGTYGQYTAVTRSAWAHAKALRRKGLIHGSDDSYQCTFFAQMWFYDVYGFNSSAYERSGDGAHFVHYVYQSHCYYDADGNLQHYFSIDDKPKAMGLISIRSRYLPDGHVVCVDEVDYENDTITISDGNTTGCGDVTIRKTMSFDEFYAQYPGNYTYVNPTIELIMEINDLK